MKQVLAALLAFTLLAGCSGAPAESPSASSSGPSASTSAGAPATTTPKVPLEPKELYNDTLAFASVRGGSNGSASLTMPAGYGNVTLLVTGLADCPGYAKGAQVSLDGPTGTITIGVPLVRATGGVPVDDPAGYAAYACSINGIVSGVQSMQRYSFGTSAGTLSAKAGSWSLAALGEFTGVAQVVVTAQP